MKRLIAITLLIFLAACKDIMKPTPTAIPVAHEILTASVPGTPPTRPAQISPTEIVNASAFPDTNEYEWRLIARGLDRPVDIQSAGDGSGRLFILEKPGVIQIYENEEVTGAPFLDIRGRVNDAEREQGLLGLAFHPDYEQNGYFYINYSGIQDGKTFISRFQAGGNAADANSEMILLTIDPPYTNHNGGAVAFGPDGYLYLGIGDGGGRGDPLKNAQNKNSLLGKILRIDVNNGDPYTIPSDNPFGNEVWAYGLRNPWRISFDKASGDLWIGDVGEGAWEEIDYVLGGLPGGTNFGWSLMEGSHGYDAEPQLGLRLPAVEYSHDSGCSVTGGYVYRGRMPEWNGIYLYGDYCTGYIWGTIPSKGVWKNQLLFQTTVNITSFGVDESGEIYMAGDNGNIYQLVGK